MREPPGPFLRRGLPTPHARRPLGAWQTTRVGRGGQVRPQPGRQSRAPRRSRALDWARAARAARAGPGAWGAPARAAGRPPAAARAPAARRTAARPTARRRMRAAAGGTGRAGARARPPPRSSPGRQPRGHSCGGLWRVQERLRGVLQGGLQVRARARVPFCRCQLNSGLRVKRGLSQDAQRTLRAPWARRSQAEQPRASQGAGERGRARRRTWKVPARMYSTQPGGSAGWAPPPAAAALSATARATAATWLTKCALLPFSRTSCARSAGRVAPHAAAPSSPLAPRAVARPANMQLCACSWPGDGSSCVMRK